MEAADATKADQSQELLATVTGIGRLIGSKGGTRSARWPQADCCSESGRRYEKASDYGAFMRDLHRMIRKDRGGQLRVQLQKYKLVMACYYALALAPALALALDLALALATVFTIGFDTSDPDATSQQCRL